MSITEEHRRNIFNGLEEAIGTEEANHLMQLLPATPASELVTRTDMHAFGTALRGEMAELRGQLRGEMAELRGELRSEMGELRGELRGEMAELRGEMSELRGEVRTDMAALRNEMADLKGSLNRLVIAGMVGNAIAVITALAV